LTLESDSPFILEGVQTEADWAAILDHAPSSISSQVLNRYDPRYLVENTEAGGGYLAYGQRYPSPFISSLHANSYKLFEVTGQSLWYAGELA
jgi:hypothetical protein